jgi:spermidine synthase
MSSTHTRLLPRSTAAGVALTSAALLMTELALTRIFSVTMYYHFAFLAISIALFGLSASGVYVFVARRWLQAREPCGLLAIHALAFATSCVVALAVLVRIRVGLNYSPENLRMMLAIYALAALPFFTGGAVVSLALTCLAARVNIVYAADLAGAAAGCLLLIPLLDTVGAPGTILVAAFAAGTAATLFAPSGRRVRIVAAATLVVGAPTLLQIATGASFDVRDTKGHRGDRVLFSRWNSFSRVAVYDRGHGDWSISPRYTGARPESRFMDIDSAASTPIVRFDGNLAGVESLRYELTSLAFRLWQAAAPAGAQPFRALVIGPGGGRDLLAALIFGAGHVDGVEINPIIANDVMRGEFHEYSGGIYTHPRVTIAVDDGRSFVRRSAVRYDIVQASLVDTWAATAAGAYTLSENSLYTVEAFSDYLDHLSDNGMLTITRWVFDGLRLVSLAQEACARRACDAADRLAVVQLGQVATFLFKKRPFTSSEIASLRQVAGDLGFTVLYAPDDRTSPEKAAPPGKAEERQQWQTSPGDYARLIVANDRHAFYDLYRHDIRPTTDDRPFFFHTTRLEHQFQVAFGRSMLFGNGLSALVTLMGISTGLVVLFVVGPLAVAGREALAPGWPRWLTYFGLLGAGFMLVEVAVLQRFVLLLGHPVYSLTVTLFSLLLGTGAGSYLSRTVAPANVQPRLQLALLGIVVVGIAAVWLLPPLIEAAIPLPRWVRIGLATALLVPAGALMGMALPSGMRLLNARQPDLVPWAWGMNGALSVVGATLAIFIAMNWGFSMTLLAGTSMYVLASVLMRHPLGLAAGQQESDQEI